MPNMKHHAVFIKSHFDSFDEYFFHFVYFHIRCYRIYVIFSIFLLQLLRKYITFVYIDCSLKSLHHCDFNLNQCENRSTFLLQYSFILPFCSECKDNTSRNRISIFFCNQCSNCSLSKST